jgi:hypothetical protein
MLSNALDQEIQRQRAVVAEQRRRLARGREQWHGRAPERRAEEARKEEGHRAQRRGYRLLYTVKGTPTPTYLLEWDLSSLLERDGCDPDPRLVARNLTFLQQVWTAHGIRADVAALDTGYAVARWRIIEIPDPRTQAAIAVAAHETAHVLRPCRPGHRRVPAGCPRCEIAAWAWGVEALPDWTRDMHRRLIASLSTYRPSAIPAERAAMDRLMAWTTFQRALVQRWQQ